MVSLSVDDSSREVLEHTSILKSANKNRNDDQMNDAERKERRVNFFSDIEKSSEKTLPSSPKVDVCSAVQSLVSCW